MEEIRTRYRALVATQVGLPVGFLSQAWGTEYHPGRHFFQRDSQGRLESKWAHDVSLWEKMTQGYLLWNLVSHAESFWDLIYTLLLMEKDFFDDTRTPMAFRVWVFFKKYGERDLVSILQEVEHGTGVLEKVS